MPKRRRDGCDLQDPQNAGSSGSGAVHSPGHSTPKTGGAGERVALAGIGVGFDREGVFDALHAELFAAVADAQAGVLDVVGVCDRGSAHSDQRALDGAGGGHRGRVRYRAADGGRCGILPRHAPAAAGQSAALAGSSDRGRLPHRRRVHLGHRRGGVAGRDSAVLARRHRAAQRADRCGHQPGQQWRAGAERPPGVHRHRLSEPEHPRGRKRRLRDTVAGGESLSDRCEPQRPLHWFLFQRPGVASVGECRAATLPGHARVRDRRAQVRRRAVHAAHPARRQAPHRALSVGRELVAAAGAGAREASPTRIPGGGRAGVCGAHRTVSAQRIRRALRVRGAGEAVEPVDARREAACERAGGDPVAGDPPRHHHRLPGAQQPAAVAM
eukprot:ctg_336.g184